MNSSRLSRYLSPVLLASVGAAALVSACDSNPTVTGTTGSGTSSGGNGGNVSSGNANGGGGALSTGAFNPTGGDHGDVVSLVIDQKDPTIVSENNATVSQTFTATATYTDGTSEAVSPTWGADGLAIGSIDGGGIFTANGTQGGVANIVASVGKATATTTLTVKLHLLVNPGNVDAGTLTALQGASTQDGAATLSYPYEATVFPRGLVSPPIMWTSGATTDTVYVHIVSPTFELESFTTNLPNRYAFDQAVWDAFVNSTSGAAELKVARSVGGTATLIGDEHWSIGPGRMQGTIYYWAINAARVMRIKPGATAPDDFLPNDPYNPSGGQGSETCPACHTVSAKGNMLVMNAGWWGEGDEYSVSYDLVQGAQQFSGYYTGGNTSHGASAFAEAAVTPDGATIVENLAPVRGAMNQATMGAYDSASGSKLSGSGLESANTWTPAFSPDGLLLAYVNGSKGDLTVADWDPVNKVASNSRVVMTGNGNQIQYPAISPDHKLIVYQRSSGLGSLGIPGDLYLVSVDNPNVEIPLDGLNGTNYPFTAGSRDKDSTYEPTFAPISSGGYFWLVFHSRRTFGNLLTGQAFGGEGNGTKQLWVSAIDLSLNGTADPSHPAFHLEGQALNTLNQRGYWALDPCKSDGATCESGTDCCGGFCSGDPGVCKSSSGGDCSKTGDHCDKPSDCCDAAGGATCINNVCSDAAPPQ